MNQTGLLVALVQICTMVCLVDAAFEKDDGEDLEEEESIRNNSSKNCTNDYCMPDADYIDYIIQHLYPTTSGWILIMMHCVVFVAGLVGNALVCVAVYRNHAMRTVTNYLIVNLAVADLLVILACLPSTVVWDITETWFLGHHLCKAILYLQTVSVSVSVLTLTFISIDRWYAICFPLRFNSTTGRAKTAIVIIWIISLLLDIPDLVMLQVQPTHLRVKTVLYSQCAHSWGKKNQLTFTLVKFAVLYAVPLLFMSVAYWQIVRVLWRGNIPGHNLSARVCNINEIPPPGRGNPEGQLRSRRKAAKMLVAVVITFAICYFPVYTISILRNTISLNSSELINSMGMIAHWLCYVNSAANPLIYNFMSGKFRKEFRRAFRDCKPTGYRDGHKVTHKVKGYARTANGYRSILLNRREKLWQVQKRESWTKKSPNATSKMDDTAETNLAGTRSTSDTENHRVHYF